MLKDQLTQDQQKGCSRCSLEVNDLVTGEFILQQSYLFEETVCAWDREILNTNSVYFTLTELAWISSWLTYFINASLVEWPPVDSVLTTRPTLSVFSHASYQMSLAAENNMHGLCVLTAWLNSERVCVHLGSANGLQLHCSVLSEQTAIRHLFQQSEPQEVNIGLLR